MLIFFLGGGGKAVITALKVKAELSRFLLLERNGALTERDLQQLNGFAKPLLWRTGKGGNRVRGGEDCK